jgi:hypothetical protein
MSSYIKYTAKIAGVGLMTSGFVHLVSAHWSQSFFLLIGLIIFSISAWFEKKNRQAEHFSEIIFLGIGISMLIAGIGWYSLEPVIMSIFISLGFLLSIICHSLYADKNYSRREWIAFLIIVGAIFIALLIGLIFLGTKI